MPNIDNVGSLLLAQQMPQIAKFSGEDLENEAFDDWLTQFEMIASMFFNLSTGIRDLALS